MVRVAFSLTITLLRRIKSSDHVVSLEIKVCATERAMVAIKPVQNTVNKSYWKGITIHESTSISIVEFLKLSNAQTGLNIKSKLRARGLSLDNCGSIGINIESTLSDSIDLKDIEIIKSDGVGLFIDKGNVFIDWVYIHRCEGIGIVNNNFGVVDIKNTKIIKK